MASDIPYDWDNAAALDGLNRGKGALDWTKYDDGYRWLNTPTQPGLTNLESGGYDSWFDIGALPRFFKNAGQNLVNSKDLYIRQAAYALHTNVDNPKAQALGSLWYANSSWIINPYNNGGEQPWSHLSQNQQNQIPLFLMGKYENDPNFKAVVDEGDQDKFRAYVSRYLQGVGEDTDLLANPDSIQNSLAPTTPTQGQHAADDHAAEVAKKTYEDFISPGIDRGSEVAASLVADRKKANNGNKSNIPEKWYDQYRRTPPQHKSIEEINQETIRKFGRLI